MKHVDLLGKKHVEGLYVPLRTGHTAHSWREEGLGSHRREAVWSEGVKKGEDVCGQQGHLWAGFAG